MTAREKDLVAKYERTTALSIGYHEALQVLVGNFEGIPVVNASTRGKPLLEALKTLRTYNLRRIMRQRMKETGGRCENCGKVRPLHLHHKQFRSQMGTDHPSNLIALCGAAGACHDRQHGLVK